MFTAAKPLGRHFGTLKVAELVARRHSSNLTTMVMCVALFYQTFHVSTSGLGVHGAAMASEAQSAHRKVASPRCALRSDRLSDVAKSLTLMQSVELLHSSERLLPFRYYVYYSFIPAPTLEAVAMGAARFTNPSRMRCCAGPARIHLQLAHHQWSTEGQSSSESSLR